MTNQHINTIMDRLEQMNDMMEQHQTQGNHDLAMLLDKEARELATLMDGGEEMITFPQPWQHLQEPPMDSRNPLY